MKSDAHIETRAPRLFKTAAVLVIWSYGILLIVPVAAAFLAITMMRLNWWTTLVPLFTLAATAWFVPLGQGNSYIARRLRGLGGASSSLLAGGAAYVVQLSLNPRLRKGLRASLEDADDFGYLSFGEDSVTFAGDSISLNVPYANIKHVSQQNVGLRGRFVYGPRVTIAVEGLSGTEVLEFAERSSTFIPQSKRIARELVHRFERAREGRDHSSSSSSNSSSSSSSSPSPNSIKSALSTRPSEAFSTASQGSPFSARG